MTDPARMTDEELLSAYYGAVDDARADHVFAELDRRFRNRLLLSLTVPGYNRAFVKLHRKPGVEQLAEELVSETLMRVAATRGRPSARWSSDRQAVSPWIHGILRNVVISHLRKKKLPVVSVSELHTDEGSTTSPLDSAAASGPAPDETLEHQALLDALRACVADLPDDLRQICEMIFDREMRQNEVADQLGLSAPTLTRRKQEVCERLRECLRRKGMADDLFC